MAQRPVTIEIDGFKTRDVLNVYYSLHRAVDSDGQPVSKPSIGGIHVTVKALEDGNTELAEWMVDSFEHKEGKLVYMSTDKNKLLKEIKFSRAYIVSYTESYSEGVGIMEEFEISPQEMKIGNATLKEVWAEAIS